MKQYIKQIIKRLLYFKDEIIWNRHINKVYKRLAVKKGVINHELIVKHKKYWGRLKKRVNPKWFEVYSFITENHDILYVPENIYFNQIEPKLNNRELALAYADKNIYEMFLYRKDIFPETILRNIGSLFYDKDYVFLKLDEKSLQKILLGFQKFLIKPAVDSGGGRKIQLFSKDGDYFSSSDGKKLTLNYLKQEFGQDYIIQNYIQQCDFLSRFNPTSVNTIRIFTYRSVLTDEVIPLHAVLRIGKKGNYLDDQNIGGVACRISEDSSLNKYATNYWGEKFYEFNGVIFDEIRHVPKVDEMKHIVIELAKKNIHSRVMGFDFTIDNYDNIKLIEINHLWTGINFFQMNGASVFGKYSDEVVEFCRNN